ncbi:MAG: hypothetical protein FWB71_03810 [Defluviitaleaceae bacterium]|nr:hypothetical protein [Defluviitaleaceae bacterium]
MNDYKKTPENQELFKMLDITNKLGIIAHEVEARGRCNTLAERLKRVYETSYRSAISSIRDTFSKDERPYHSR